MSKFSTSDVVSLKSGGPKMTVKYQHDPQMMGGPGDEVYEVTWFSADGILQTATINGDVLVKVE